MNQQKTQLLFIEDEQNLAEIIKESLEMRQFSVTHCTTVKEGLRSFLDHVPDIIVLDVMLPDGDGFELARQIRQVNRLVPIIFLTARLLPNDVVEGFESGGNDYLKKPFSLEELVVRIRVLLSNNRTLYNDKTGGEEIIPIGLYRFQHHAAKLFFSDRVISLTARESELLKMLALNSNQVVDRKTLLTRIWGNDDFFSGRSLDVFITKLRKYLREDPAITIMNIRGIGYKLICP